MFGLILSSYKKKAENRESRIGHRNNGTFWKTGKAESIGKIPVQDWTVHITPNRLIKKTF